MKTFLIFVTACAISISGYTQPGIEEFEGVITYKTSFVLKDSNVNVDMLKKMFGTTLKYYYKQGRYKWVIQDAPLEYEIFDPYVSPTTLVHKFVSNDTLYFTDVNETMDSVVQIVQGSKRDILGIHCQSTTFSVWLGDTLGTKMLRTMYYSPDSLKYKTAYYNGYRAVGQGFISRYIGSIPLRLEFDGQFQSFIVAYEAISLERKILRLADFYINPDLPKALRDYSR